MKLLFPFEQQLFELYSVTQEFVNEIKILKIPFFDQIM